MSDDHSANIETTGRVVVGGTATGEIEQSRDRDWFAVELLAGHVYRIDLKGSPTGDGTLSDPYLRGIHDAEGNRIANTTDDDGGVGRNSQVTFTAARSGTYHVAAGAFSIRRGTYELEVTDVSPPRTPPGPDTDDARTGASDLGDITALVGPRFPRNELDGDADRVDYYRFTLTEAKQVGLGLRQLDANAELYLEDAGGNVLHRSTESGTSNEAITETLLAGTYYARVEAVEAGDNRYVFRYGVSAPDAAEVERLEAERQAPQTQQQAVQGPPTFAAQRYAFTFMENADGSADRVSLGVVSATDPDRDTLSYSIESGNESSRFEVEATTGELFYVGSGEDYESGTTGYELTVRVSDGGLHTDVSVNVSVTDVAEVPTFTLTAYAFELAENADGSADRVSLGVVSATDPDRDTLSYSIESGNESSRFEVEATTGELFYVGSGEDYESGTTGYGLTVRVSDGGLHTDVSVNVSIADVAEVPTFTQTAYAFELAENADGSADRVSLGVVSATDPDRDTLSYSIESGNESSRFEVEATTGELFYVGSGEDYESGTTGYGLTVRVSDGGLHTDVSVNVSVTDVAEVPTFTLTAYAFELAENADGSADRVSLGVVSATDPDRDTLSYSIESGNESDRFAVEATTGELFYVGSGEDYESDTTGYGLTVRVSDGGLHTDVSVNVSIADVNEPADQSAARETVASVSEPEGQDFSADDSSDGRVVVGGTATGEIEQSRDRDWFAVELVAGHVYRIDLKGSPTGDGTLSDPYLRGIHDAEGNRIANTTDDDGGVGRNSQVTFTAARSGTYHVAAGAFSIRRGTYELEVTDVSPPRTPPGPDTDDARTGASDLGDITALVGPRFPRNELDGDADRVDYYRFTLTEAKQVGLGLRQLDANAELYLEDAGGNVLHRSTESGTSNEAITETLLAGTYYARVEAVEAGDNRYVFRYGVSAPDAAEVERLEAERQASQTQQQAVQGPPTFAAQRYAFTFMENADGSADRVSLGVVSATDPDRDTLSYSIESGNESSRFEVEATTGELFYVGSGEDYESGTTGYELTVRVSDGGLHTDVSVNVSVTDVAEVPTFTLTAYAFELAENADGSADRVSLGVVSATDPDRDTLSYSIESGNESSRFEVEATTGELFYVGSGEDYESDTTGYGLTVRVSDGGLHTDVSVNVSIADVAEVPTLDKGADRLPRTDSMLPEDPDGSTRANATDLGDLTYEVEFASAPGTVDGGADVVDYFRFTLSRAREVHILFHAQDDPGPILHALDANADLFLEDSRGNVLAAREQPGNIIEGVSSTLLAGTYFVRVEAQETGGNAYSLTYKTSRANPEEVERLVAQHTPSFDDASYDFTLLENANGSTNRVSLGTISATDPNGDIVSYDLDGGNESGLFEIDGATGELSYVGEGEDFEGGAGPFELTIGASDGERSAHATVTVTVTDAAEAPSFRKASYAFALPEGRDGSMNRVSLGRVSATDPDGDTLSYGIQPGTASDLFAVDGVSGEVFYIGTGEAFESNTGPFGLTVRVRDDQQFADTVIDVTVTEVTHPPAFAKSFHDFTLSENTDGSTSPVLLGTVSATDPDDDTLSYSIQAGNELDLFAVEETTGELFYVGAGEDYESGARVLDLTVRASDGTNAVDTAVTVTVVDVEEEPVFGAERYAFALPELADGSANRLLLGTVSATDPDDDTLTYSIQAGNESDLFAVEETTGELFYVGAGEDYESGARVFDLTVRASDGTNAVDAPVRATVTDRQPVAERPGEDLADGRSTSGIVVVGEAPVTGRIDSQSDRDWYAVTLAPGRAYRITLERDGGERAGPRLYRVFDSHGDDLPHWTNRDGTGIDFLTDADASDTTYYVAVYVHPDDTLHDGGYGLRVREIIDDYAADTGTAGTVAVGGSVQGTIDPVGDRDWIAVELEEGRTYRIHLRASFTNDGTLVAPHIHGIRDSAGNLVDGPAYEDVGRIETSRLTFRAGQTATYYVDAGVRGFEWPGTYTLSVSDVTDGGDDFAADIGTDGRVAVGGSVTGEIETEFDVDWFAVRVERGWTYRFEVKGQATGDGTLAEPAILQVYESPGANGNWSDHYVSQSLRELIPQERNPHAESTYFVAVKAGNAGQDTWLGTYTLEAAVIGPTDDYPANTGTDGMVAVGGSVTGEIQVRNEDDWFAVTLEAGKTYRFDLEGSPTGDGTLRSPYLRGIFDSEGNLIEGTTDHGGYRGYNSHIVGFIPDETTTYYVAAGSRGGQPGTYTLSAIEIVDDYASDISTTGTVGVSESATGSIDLVGDRDWFAVTLEADHFYRFDLKGAATGDGTLRDPYLAGIRDSEGNLIANTTNDDSGEGQNSRLGFIADATDTYYVSVGAEGGWGSWGTYTLYVLSSQDVIDGM